MIPAPTSAPNIVEVRGLTKIYGSAPAQVRALDGVDLDVRRGELLMLAGPSGSGKTTLLSIIGCLLQPTSGSVRILSCEIAGLNERELPRKRLDHIGFVFQAFNLFSTLTAGENVELVLELKGMARRAARRMSMDLLSQVGLSARYDALPSQLSGGEKQRVAIARALAGNPDIILADEPTASLDWKYGLTVVEKLRELAHRQQRAVVMVTHDLRALPKADRVVRMEDGRLVEGTIPGSPEGAALPDDATARLDATDCLATVHPGRAAE